MFGASIRRLEEGDRTGLVWIGNWGDGERTAELESFLFHPAQEAGLPLDIYGVRYPAEALATLDRYGVAYHGWAPNAAAPGDLRAAHGDSARAAPLLFHHPAGYSHDPRVRGAGVRHSAGVRPLEGQPSSCSAPAPTSCMPQDGAEVTDAPA